MAFNLAVELTVVLVNFVLVLPVDHGAARSWEEASCL